MCCGCWQEDGSPKIDNEKVRAIQPLIAEVYRHSAVGGNLHCVLDDNNLDDDFLTDIVPDEDDSPEQTAAERACLDALRAMTEEERISALGLSDGCWRIEPSEL